MVAQEDLDSDGGDVGQAMVASLAQRSLVTLVEYDKDLCVTLQKVLSVDRHRELNFVFF